MVDRGADSDSDVPAADVPVEIPLGHDRLLGDLSLPRGALGIVLFAHGSGSGRRSPRNRYVAARLQREGFGTLLLDLLTPREAAEDERTMAYRFETTRLGGRLVRAIDWVTAQPAMATLPVGAYGASTGGAAALLAAAERPREVHALVLRGARSDLAADALPRVRAPTLLLVGGHDPPILAIARETAGQLAAAHATVVVRNASHLFEEPGALDAVAEETANWFRRHLPVAVRA